MFKFRDCQQCLILTTVLPWGKFESAAVLTWVARSPKVFLESLLRALKTHFQLSPNTGSEALRPLKGILRLGEAASSLSGPQIASRYGSNRHRLHAEEGGAPPRGATREHLHSATRSVILLGS